ncbi:hypothetical protein pb186bvf_007694 [Paramecium bursaria]
MTINTISCIFLILIQMIFLQLYQEQSMQKNSVKNSPLLMIRILLESYPLTFCLLRVKYVNIGRVECLRNIALNNSNHQVKMCKMFILNNVQ